VPPTTSTSPTRARRAQRPASAPPVAALPDVATAPVRPARATGSRTVSTSRPPATTATTTPARSAPTTRATGTAPAGRTTAPAPAATTKTPEGVPARSAPAHGFAELGVPPVLVGALTAQGIETPFPIQDATLRDTLAGRDVLGRGRTGSGKTLAFAIPLVALLSSAGQGSRPARPRGLVLAPTRELASQIALALEPLARAAGLEVTTVFGGVAQSRQVTALRRGADIVVACPGRLDDLRTQGLVHLDAVEITVLDEGDHMADLGFLPVVRRLLDTTPARGQRMLFSATLDKGVDVLVRRYLHDPLTHSVDPVVSDVPAMTHHLLEVASPTDKTAVVHRLASGTTRRVLFTRTKHRARSLARQLTAAGIPAVDLHGNLTQGARERNLAAFSSGAVKVLVATDIAARGIHVDHVDLVVHVDPPAEHKAYLHRSGRTARAGSSGQVVTVMLPTERNDVRQLTRAAGISASPQAVHASHAAVVALAGEPAGRPVAVPTPVRSSPAGRPRR
jgi:superfamily II DNA/RNA helicase